MTHTPFSERAPRPGRRFGLALALALFALALLWALLLPLGRQLLAAGVTGLELAFWRGLLAGGALFLPAGLSRRLRPLRHRDWGLFLPLGFLGLGSFMAALVMVDVPAHDLRFWLYLAPALLTVAFWLVTPPSPRKLYLTFFLALVAGMLLLLGAGQLPSLLWGLVLGVSLVGYLHFSQLVLARYAPWILYALGLLLGALALLPLVAFADKSPSLWLGLAAFAFGSSYLLYVLVGAVLRLLGVSKEFSIAWAEPLAVLLSLAPLLVTRFHPLELLMAGLPLALVFLLPVAQTEPIPVRERPRDLPGRLHYPT